MMQNPNVMPQGQRPGMGAPMPGQLTTPAPGQTFTPGQRIAPGQTIAPGQFVPQASPYSPSTVYSGTAQPTRPPLPGPGSRQITASPNPQPPPGATGTVAPGMATAPIQIQTTPYSNAGPPTMSQPDEATWQGQASTVPGQSTAGAARPGEVTAPAPTAFRNPYGLPEPVRPAVTDPNANPYGLPNPVKTPATGATTTPGATTPGTTTPGTTTTTGPIKKDSGGEG
jgi:hypothetical protein